MAHRNSGAVPELPAGPRRRDGGQTAAPLRRSLARFLLLALLLLPLPAQAAPAQVHVTGRYSLVLAPDRASAEEVASLIDRAVPRAAQLTGATDLTPIRALVHPDRPRFSAATGAARGGRVVGLAVFPSQVIHLDGSGVFASVRRVVPHEVGHVLVYRAVGPGVARLPRWVNEGIAEYVARSAPAYVDPAAMLALRGGGTLPLAELDAAFGREDTVDTAYAESASLIEFLVARSGQDSIASLLQALRVGEDFPPALAHVTGLTPEAFQAAWGKWVRPRTRPLPDLTMLLWLAMVVLLFLAFLRMLRERRRPEREMEEE